MSEYLKKAVKTAATDDSETRSVVEAMLQDIRHRRESAVREYAAKLDRWDKDVVVPPDQVRERVKDIPQSVRDDFQFARDQVFGFAVKQRESMHEFSTERRLRYHEHRNREGRRGPVRGRLLAGAR